MYDRDDVFIWSGSLAPTKASGHTTDCSTPLARDSSQWFRTRTRTEAILDSCWPSYLWIRTALLLPIMSSSLPQCTYTYDPPGETTPDDRIDVQRPSFKQCPHDTVDPDSQRCIFHHGEHEYPSGRFTEQFLHRLNDPESPTIFAGGRLSGLELDNQTVTTPNQEPIDLRGVVIDGDIDLTNSTIEVPILLDGAAIKGDFLAENAEFRAPVSLIDTDLSGRLHAYNATIEGGLDAHKMNAGYVDGRSLKVDGSVVFAQASFASNLLFAHASVDGDFAIEDASFDWSIDITAATIGRDFRATDATVDANLDVVATEIAGDIEIRKLAVSGDTDWSHAVVGGNLIASDCAFDGEVSFDNVAINGEAMVFDGTVFTAKANFATMSLLDSRVSFSEVTFEDEVWFTHTTIGGYTNFSGATFNGMSHLRDAVFKDDLSLRNVRSTGQFFLHGTTVEGDFDSTDAHFDHYQFSATVQGTADFSRARFDEKAIFKSSTFEDRVWFDDVSFAGHPDFSDTRFTEKTTFDGTVFLVDPTFEETRFAIEPDMTVADFSVADAVDFEDRRSQMILDHPESLQHDGAVLPLESITGDIAIPNAATHLIEDEFEKTKRVAKALTKFDRQAWYALVESPLRTARTATTRLPNQDPGVIVLALTVTSHTHGPDTIDEVLLAGVYCRTDEEVVFGHLDPALLSTDYLVPIPTDDDAFESGAEVATATELHKAAVKNETLRAALLGKHQTEDSYINQMIVPVLVGAGKLA